MNARRIFVQVGDKENDEQFWGRPEQIPANNRKSYFVTSKKPGSDVVGEMAAAMAAISIVFAKYRVVSAG